MMQPIYATFADPDMAQKAAGALLDHGLKAENISIIFPEGYYKDSDKSGADMEASAEKGISTTTADDAKSGAAKGAGIGLAAGALAALASIFIPGVGLVIGGGALAMAAAGTAGATAAGAVAGGLTGFLKDQGVPEEVIQGYSTVLGSGGATMTITPAEDVDSAKVNEIVAKYSGTVATYGSVQSRATAL